MEEKENFKSALEWIAPGLRQETQKGGAGSGNFGHAGRPGKVGGSATSSLSGRGDVQTMYSSLIAEGGFTYNPITNSSPKSGFALSIFPQHETVLDADSISPDIVRSFIQKTADIIHSNPKAHLGGWFDKDAGKIYLDVSIIVNDAEEARQLCMQHNQEGFYDLEKGETIIVKAEEERRKEKEKEKLTRFEFGRDATAEEIVKALEEMVASSKKSDDGEDK